MKKTTKGRAFWAGIVSLDLFFFATTWLAPAALTTVAPIIVCAITAACGFFHAAQVADNALKGKFYEPALDKEGK